MWFQITPETQFLPKAHPTDLAPDGGHVGIEWPTFISSKNGAPFYPFDGVKDYPTIGGRTQIDSKGSKYNYVNKLVLLINEMY